MFSLSHFVKSSARYKRVFLFRFVAYFAVILGSLASVAQFGPIVSAEFNYRKDQIMGNKYTLDPQIVTSEGVLVESPQPSSTDPEPSGGGFGDLVSNSRQSKIQPVSTEYGIVIEKINANAKIIPQIDPGNEKEYVSALQQGVAEAKGSTEPGLPGNIYIFSHSVDAPWNVARYNAIFYLLRELEQGDRVILFYKGRRFDYIVFDKTTAKPSDTSFLANRYNKPVLTLQTCDPPGTLLNRLVVRAKLAGS